MRLWRLALQGLVGAQAEGCLSVPEEMVSITLASLSTRLTFSSFPTKACSRTSSASPLQVSRPGTRTSRRSDVVHVRPGYNHPLDPGLDSGLYLRGHTADRRPAANRERSGHREVLVYGTPSNALIMAVAMVMDALSPSTLWVPGNWTCRS